MAMVLIGPIFHITAAHPLQTRQCTYMCVFWHSLLWLIIWAVLVCIRWRVVDTGFEWPCYPISKYIARYMLCRNYASSMAIS